MFNSQHTHTHTQSFLQKLKHNLGLCPKVLKSAYYSDAATLVFIAAQFTLAKPWNQPRCSSTDEWVKKLVHIHNGILFILKEDYYSPLKNEMMAFAGKWIELENVMLSEISQSQKTKGRMFSPIRRW